MRVAVLGAGNGGVAAAFDFAQHGHEVSLCATPEFGTNVVAVNEAGGSPPAATSRASRRSATPGTTTARRWRAPSSWCSWPRPTGSSRTPAAAPYLTEGKSVLVCPGSCAGAIAFKRAAGLELDDERVIVGETSTLPYAVRVTEPGVINVFLKLTPTCTWRRCRAAAPTGCTTSSRTSGPPSRGPTASSRPRCRTATRSSTPRSRCSTPACSSAPAATSCSTRRA